MSERVEFSKDTIVVVASEILSNKLSDEEAILNLKNSVYYGLDPVGARIWALIQKPISVDDILNTLLQEYDVERDLCLRDIQDLLGKLASEDLIVVRNAKTS